MKSRYLLAYLLIFLSWVSNVFPSEKEYYKITNADIAFRIIQSDVKTASIISNLQDSVWEKSGRSVFYLNLNDIKEIWLKVKIHNNKYDKPFLSLRTFGYGFEIYQNGKVIYQYGFQSKDSNYKNTKWHLIPLDTTKASQYFLVRLPMSGYAYLGSFIPGYIGERSSLEELAQDDIIDFYKTYTKDFIIGTLLLFICFVSLLIFFIRIRVRDYSFVYFSLFALLGGTTYINDTPLFLLHNISPLAYTVLEDISTYALPIGILLFVGRIFGKGWKNIINKLCIFHLLLTLTACIFTFLRIACAYTFFSFVLAVLVDFVVMTTLIYKSRNSAGYNIKPVLYSFILFSLCGIHDLLVILNLLLPWTTILFGWGLLGIVFSFGYIMIKHYMDTYHLVSQYSIELAEKKDELDKLQQENLLSQFEALKTQINPHFLFNTFSTLIDIIEENPGLAANFVQQLSNVYRYVLQSKDNQSVELKCELEFLESYNFLLSKRYGSNLQMIININPEFYDRHIPPLTLQLLIENVIKHNIISSKKPLRVEIQTDEDDYLVVKNNLQKKSIVESSTKIGLQNIINRYKYLSDRKVEVISNQFYFLVRIPFLYKQVEK